MFFCEVIISESWSKYHSHSYILWIFANWTLLFFVNFIITLWVLNVGSYQSTLKQLFQEFDPGEPEAQLASVTTRIMQALQNNLDGKSKQYKDPALTQLFLMNNIHYIVRSVRRLVVDFFSFRLWNVVSLRFFLDSMPFCILYVQVRGKGNVGGWLGTNTQKNCPAACKSV